MALAGIAPEDDDGHAAAQAAPKPKKTSAAQMKQGLSQIDNDLIDCATIEDVDRCAKIWAEIMKQNEWSRDYVDFARPKFAQRREAINAAAIPANGAGSDANEIPFE